jgi:hypothetical protein
MNARREEAKNGGLAYSLIHASMLFSAFQSSKLIYL